MPNDEIPGGLLLLLPAINSAEHNKASLNVFTQWLSLLTDILLTNNTAIIYSLRHSCECCTNAGICSD